MADNESKCFGAAVPALNYTWSDAVSVAVPFSGALAISATLISRAGNYSITLGTHTAGGNYDLTFVPGSLTVKPSLSGRLN